MEQWKKKQEHEIEQLIDNYVRDNTRTIGECVVPPPHGWMRYAKDYICNYLKYWDQCSWIEFLCMQDNDSHFMTSRGEELKKYLIRIRNYARKTCSIIGDGG